MKKCQICLKSDKIHYRVRSKIIKDWIFCCKQCWNIISKQNDYSYGGTRKSKWSCKLNCETNEISRSSEFCKIALNRRFTNNYGMQIEFIKLTNKNNFLFYLLYLLNIIFIVFFLLCQTKHYGLQRMI